MDPHGHGLGHGSVFAGQGVGGGDEGVGGDEELLGIAAGEVVAVADGVVVPFVEETGHGRGALADGDAGLCIRAVGEDFDAELVPHDDVTGEVHVEDARAGFGGGDELGRELEGVEVGSADAAGERFDEHLTGPGLGIGDLVDEELSVAHDHCLHGIPLPWVR